MNTAIIVAAGSGTRIDATRPKQFLEIHGKPVVVHTLERFENCDSIDQIILVLPERQIGDFERLASGSSISKLTRIVPGGDNRSRSVQCGLDAVDEMGDIVAVHDGARPLVTEDEIARTVEGATVTGAACLVAAVSDTIKLVVDDRIVRTLDRTELRRALTPQECMLVEKLGVPIAVVEGSACNIKITHPEDLVLAETLMSFSNYTSCRT
jgi:2-C-methyl-D-erythritol 4-phosphate cytidylyltransferase